MVRACAIFGRQFRADTLRVVKPSTTDGIERFLASGAVKGIGRTMAARIVEHFGSRTLTVMESEPERLTEVAGIGRKKGLKALRLRMPNSAKCAN